jgi:hypothetical protein
VDDDLTINRSSVGAIFAVAIPVDELGADPYSWDVVASCAP